MARQSVFCFFPLPHMCRMHSMHELTLLDEFVFIFQGCDSSIISPVKSLLVPPVELIAPRLLVVVVSSPTVSDKWSVIHPSF